MTRRKVERLDPEKEQGYQTGSDNIYTRCSYSMFKLLMINVPKISARDVKNKHS
ncbi:hypothetical protein MTBBW1_1930001 [Desulfamplus magnetovallimortis]|uniref:Uncharacterized protein n=1 Tax=Desulfamplus magnetovallimortis TaxID=1246637 RepID=A0A1W1HB51_9BACT|nr:hypothetical protein MTBBW1_1930001 [Desulfamplus magnetovallimortis]